MLKEAIMEEIYLSPNDSISEALGKVKPHTRIILGEGDFREKIEISVPDIEIVGQGAEKTRIIYDDYAKKIDEQGREYVTFRTYTSAVLAPRVTFKNLTVENDANFPETKGQEVALTVYADDFLAENCSFVSTQDTIFCGPATIRSRFSATASSRATWISSSAAGTRFLTTAR